MRKRSQRPVQSHPEAAPGVSPRLRVRWSFTTAPRDVPPPPGHPVTLYGTRRLRHMLSLSETCDLEQLCQDAARTIETLRADLASRPSKERG